MPNLSTKMIQSEINYFKETLVLNPFEFRISNEKNRDVMYKLFEIPVNIREKVEYLGTLIRINIFQLDWKLSINKEEVIFIQNDVKHYINLNSRGSVLELLMLNGYINNAQLTEINPNLIDFLFMIGFTQNSDNSYSNQNYHNTIKIISNHAGLLEIEII